MVLITFRLNLHSIRFTRSPLFTTFWLGSYGFDVTDRRPRRPTNGVLTTLSFVFLPVRLHVATLHVFTQQVSLPSLIHHKKVYLNTVRTCLFPSASVLFEYEVLVLVLCDLNSWLDRLDYALVALVRVVRLIELKHTGNVAAWRQIKCVFS